MSVSISTTPASYLLQVKLSFINPTIILTKLNTSDCKEEIRQSISDNPWAAAFFMYLRKKDSEHNCSCRSPCNQFEVSNMFLFSILTSNLELAQDRERELALLQRTRSIFYSDNEDREEFKPAFKFSTFEKQASKQDQVER